MVNAPFPDLEQRRAARGEALRRDGVPLSDALAAAFLKVPRHLFVPGVYLDAVYRDQPIVTRRDKDGVPLGGSTQPSWMAFTLDALELQPGQRVLEIGTGTGYNAALLAELVGPEGKVTSIETDEETAEAARAHLDRAGYSRVEIVLADGALGHADGAPYDRIISTVSVWDLPTPWPAQLAEDGILVTALTTFGIQFSVALGRRPGAARRGDLVSRSLFPIRAVSIKGQAAGPERYIRIPASAMQIDFMSEARMDAAGLHTLFSSDYDLTQFSADIGRHNLGMFSYYLLFFCPPGYEFVTYAVEEGQLAYGMQGIGWGIVSPTSAAFVPYGDERLIHLFGSGEAGYLLDTLARQWDAAGRPDLSRCRMHITPAGARPALPAEPEAVVRVVAQPAHTYTLWIDPAL